MSIFNFIAGKVGPDVTNIILDYKEDLERADRYRKIVTSQIPNMCKISMQVSGIYENYKANFILERKKVNELLEKYDIQQTCCKSIHISSTLYANVTVIRSCNATWESKCNKYYRGGHYVRKIIPTFSGAEYYRYNEMAAYVQVFRRFGYPMRDIDLAVSPYRFGREWAE